MGGAMPSDVDLVAASLLMPATAPVPRLTEVRAAALLRGIVPCFDPALAEAYGQGVRMLALDAEVEIKHEELRPEELCSLLASQGPLRALGVGTLLALVHAGGEAASAALNKALAVGVLPLVFHAAAAVAEELERESVATMTPALAEMSTCADLLALLCSAAIFPSSRNLGITASQQLRRLAAACAFMVRDAAAEHARGAAAADMKVAIAVKLIEAFYFVELHATTNDDMPDEVYANEFRNSAFLGAALYLLIKSPRMPRAASLGKIFHYGSNYFEFNQALAAGVIAVPATPSFSSGGAGAAASFRGTSSASTSFDGSQDSAKLDAIKCILDALSSTSHDDATMLELLSCIGNLIAPGGGYAVIPGGMSTRDPDAMRKILLAKGALHELQPAILSGNPSVALDAAFTATGLASWQGASAAANESGVLTLVLDVLRTVPAGYVILPHTQWGSNDVPDLLLRLHEDSHPAVQLAALGSLAATLSRERNRALIAAPLVSGAVRALAATSDPFVFSTVIFILRELGMPLPTFRASRETGTPQATCHKHPETWSIDQVVAWAGQQPFGVYRSVFRKGMVSGKVLLSLTEKELAENGVEHSLHRKSILFAIEELKQEADSAGASSGGSHPALPLATKTQAYDVFISYRRAGGQDFAHLLKQSLSVGGREVFLDVENIGTGSFADTLDRSLKASRNVVLVWSKGCMDRFLDGKDPQSQDFVRREYALSLALQKNIVPVAKEDFVRALCVSPLCGIGMLRHHSYPLPLPPHTPLLLLSSPGIPNS
jgi:hypothetical protein